MGSGQAGAGGKRGTRGRWTEGKAGALLASTCSAVSAPLLAQTPHTCANSRNSSARSEETGQKEASGTPVKVPEENVLQVDGESGGEATEHGGRPGTPAGLRFL